MVIRLAADLQRDSIVDGPGLRTVIWTQGCLHNCPGCHNPETHDPKGGFAVDIEKIKEEIKTLEQQQGITFSGGDPLYQIDAVLELAKFITSQGFDIWVYSGFTYEEILKMPKGKELLSIIDCLVDGKFELDKRTLDAPFRGSTNQRIIDTKKSIKNGEVVLVERYMKKKDFAPLKERNPRIFI